jgi:hypothetical protein
VEPDAAILGHQPDGEIVVGEHALRHLGDLGEHLLQVERPRQRLQQGLERVASAPALGPQGLQLIVLDRERDEVDDRLERLHVVCGVDVRLASGEPKDAEEAVGPAQGQHQHGAIAQRHQRPVAGERLIELPGRIADADGQSARLGPETRGVVGAPQRTIEPLAGARPIRAERDRDRIVGSVGEPDAHRVDGGDELRRRRGAPEDFLAIERIGDRARDRRASLAEGRRTTARQLTSGPRACAPAPARRTSAECSA